jgi:cyclic pyranopterin phosphate synthase
VEGGSCKGKVLSINLSKRKGVPKSPVDEAEFVEGFGIKGDAHSGGEREVSLLDEGEIKKFEEEKGIKLSWGSFAENITTSGLDLSSLKPGTMLQVGEASLRISQIGKPCHKGCAIKEQVGSCIMPIKGVFAQVIKGGKVRQGDEIVLL